MQMLLAFRGGNTSPDCHLKEPLQTELLDFHKRLMAHCSTSSEIFADPKKAAAAASFEHQADPQERSMLSKMVDKVKKSSTFQLSPPPQPAEERKSTWLVCVADVSLLSSSKGQGLYTVPVFGLLTSKICAWRHCFHTNLQKVTEL